MKFELSPFPEVTSNTQRWWDFLVKRLNYRTRVSSIKAGPSTATADLTLTLSPQAPIGATQRFAVWGVTAANANSKSVRLDKTVGGVVTTGLWTSTSAALNNIPFLLRGEVIRTSTTELAISLTIETSSALLSREMDIEYAIADLLTINLLSSPDWIVYGKRIENLEDS